MVLDTTLPKDFMRIGYDNKCFNEVWGPKIAILAKKITSFTPIFPISHL